jgi:hypothetical protein
MYPTQLWIYVWSDQLKVAISHRYFEPKINYAWKIIATNHHRQQKFDRLILQPNITGYKAKFILNIMKNCIW